MGLSITILESAHLGVTINEPFNVSLVPTAPATIDIEVGVPGASASVTVGTTTTLAPGLNATVTNVGTATNAILDFGIPRGEQGIQGIQGIQGPKGDTGDSGVAYATAPLSYNAGTKTISIDLSAYATQSFVTSQGYITISALAGYATESWVNSQGFLTTADLTGYATESWVTSQGYLTDAASDGYGYVRKNGAWSYSPKFYEVQVGAWTNLSSGQYLINDGSFVTNITAADIILSNAAGLGMRLNNTGILFPDATTQTTAGLSPATAATTYAPIAAAVPVGGATGQVLTKTSGTDYALSWQTPVVGDRYLTSSTTSNTISNGNKTFTIGTGLSYTTTQNITIAYDSLNHMHGEVLTYNSGTGVLTVDIKNHTGAGTYASWVVNVGGVTPATSVAWGSITGTLSAQTDLQSSLDAKANLASPTFTGDPKAPTPATGDNDTSIATTAFVKNQGYVTSSYVAAYYYPLTNPSNFVIPNGTTSIQVTGGTVRSIDGSDNFVSLDGSTLNFGNGSTISGLSVTGTGITYADSTVQTTAGIGDAPSDSQTYGRNNGAWVVAGGGSGSGTLTYSSPYIYDTVTASNINVLDLTSGSLNASTVTGGNAQMDSTGLTLTASSGAVITFADSTTQSTAPHDLPVGGTTGQVLTKNSATDYDASWATAGGGGGGVDIQTFGSPTTSGTFTWTKPANAKWVEVLLFGAGGGGGGGGRYATTSGRSGGSAGGGGPVFYGRIGASYLNATETVTVGAGSPGGAAKTTDNSPGGNSTATPGPTKFSVFSSGYANIGSGGSTTNAGATNARTSMFFFSTASSGGGGSGNISGGTVGTGNANWPLPTGGGGGGGQAANVTISTAGGAGGALNNGVTNAGLFSTIAGGTGGTTAGVSPTNGTSATTQYMIGGTGGGGGAYRSGVAGMDGANGGWPGGGGGGGSASDNGFISGKGGDGANGFAVIITYT